MFMTLTGRGHDAFVYRITCKKARIWTFFWLDRKQYKWFALFRLAIFARVMSSEYTSSLWNFCQLSFHELFEECLNRNTSIEIFSISSFTPIIWNMQFDTGYNYSSDKQVHFSNNQFMNGILTRLDCNINSSFRNLQIILSDLHFYSTFQFMKYGSSA